MKHLEIKQPATNFVRKKIQSLKKTMTVTNAPAKAKNIVSSPGLPENSLFFR